MQESNQIILDGQTFYREQQISSEQKRFSFKVTDDKKNIYLLKFHLFEPQLEERIMRIMNKLQEFKPPKNIVHIKKHGRYGEYYYILTEYCENTLFNQLKGKKLTNQEDLRYILVSIAEGLNYLHQKDIIHRNLKPEQVFIKDLHISNSIIQQQYKLGFYESFNDNAVVQTQFIGTPYYIAPEMIKEQQYNQSVDIWSLGTIIYELVTGKILFDGQTFYDIFDLICSQTDESPYIQEKLQVLNPEYRQLVSRMLKVTPSLRPDIKEIIRKLRNDYSKTPPKMVNRMAYPLSRNIQQFAPSKSQSPYKGNYILKKEVSPIQKLNQQLFRNISPIKSPNPQDLNNKQLQCGYIKSTANFPVCNKALNLKAANLLVL